MTDIDADLRQAIATGERERPDVRRDVDLLIRTIGLVAERRPDIDGRFIAHTAVHYADVRRPDEDDEALAALVIAQWDVEREDDLEIRAST